MTTNGTETPEREYLVLIEIPGRTPVQEVYRTKESIERVEERLRAKLVKGEPLVFRGQGIVCTTFGGPGVRLVVMAAEEAKRRQMDARVRQQISTPGIVMPGKA